MLTPLSLSASLSKHFAHLSKQPRLPPAFSWNFAACNITGRKRKEIDLRVDRLEDQAFFPANLARQFDEDRDKLAHTVP